MTKISIIVPVYNAEKYLEMTLNSVKKQTFSDFEVICVDDGSTDSSYDILQRFAAADRRFKVYHQENSGGSVTRNNALDYASGEYIAFLDNDDIYHPQYLETLYNNIITYDADISTCSYLKFYGYENYEFADTDIEPIDFVTWHPFVDKFKRKRKIEMLMWTKLYKRSVLENIRFSPLLPAINDILFNLEVLLAAKKVVVSKQKLIAYRIIETSQTQQKLSTKKLDEYKNLAIEISKLAEKHKKHKKLLEKIAADYAYGMYVRSFLREYSPQANSELYLRILSDLNFLENNGILIVKRLSIIKRIKLFCFRKKFW